MVHRIDSARKNQEAGVMFLRPRRVAESAGLPGEKTRIRPDAQALRVRRKGEESAGGALLASPFLQQAGSYPVLAEETRFRSPKRRAERVCLRRNAFSRSVLVLVVSQNFERE